MGEPTATLVLALVEGLQSSARGPVLVILEVSVEGLDLEDVDHLAAEAVVGMDLDLEGVDHLAAEAVVVMDLDLEGVDHLGVAPLATVDLWHRFLVLVADRGVGSRRIEGPGQGTKIATETRGETSDGLDG